MQTDLILQQPVAANDAELLLLFHGVGSSPEDLAPLGHALAAARPRAWVVGVRSPDRSEFGSGWQWFSVQGITELNRPERVARALPAFVERIEAWQRHAGVAAERTTLVGFSQGAIMALESTQRVAPRLASRVVAIAGRFAQAPRHAPADAVIHLLHGELDRVMPIALAVAARRALDALAASSTLDCFPGLAHGIDARVIETILRRLPTENPKQSGEPRAVRSAARPKRCSDR